MKKKSDSQSVSDLLKKLQASYLGGKEPEKKKKEKADIDDEKFREKLAAMLGKATASSEQNEKKAGATAAKQKTTAAKDDGMSKSLPSSVSPVEESETESIETVPEEPVLIAAEEPKTAPVPETVGEVVEEVVEEPTVTVDKPKRKRATRKAKATSATSTADEPEVNDVSEVVSAPQPSDETLSTPEPSTIPVAEELVEEFTDTDNTAKENTVEEGAADEPLPARAGEESTEELTEEPTKEPETVSAVHPLDKIIPLSVPTKEPSGMSAEESAKEPEPTVSSQKIPKPEKGSKHDDAVIVIRPSRAEASAPPVQKQTKNDPIRIVPKITVPPRSDAYDFAKNKKSSTADTIVIRPRVEESRKNESIVIRPRTADKPLAVPQVRQEPTHAQPIKIGKEVNSDLQTEAPKPTMKKEKNITLVPPTPSSVERAQSSEIPSVPTVSRTKKANGVSLPRTATDTPTAKKHKIRRVVNDIPVTVTHNDEDLEEVLDEPLNDSETIVEMIPVEEPEDIPAPSSKLSIFQRRQQQRQRMTEEKLSAAELIRKKSGLSEDDVAMILELGYENELGRLVGYENLKRLKSEHVKRTKAPYESQYGTAFGYRGTEYVGDRQKDSVIAAYLHDRKRLLLRLCLTALISLLVLFVEMPYLIGGVFAQTLSHPRLLTLASTALLILAALLSFRQIRSGICAFFRFSPTPYSVPALMLPVALLYNLTVLITGTEGLRVSLPLALALLLITVCDVLRLSCELRTLRLVSAEGDKHVLVAATPRKKKLRHGKKIVKIINDDDGDPRYEVRKATQTTGFFRRFNSFDSANRPFTVLLYAVFALATLTAFFGALYTSSAASALSAFMAATMLGMPLSAILIYFYPLCHANRLLARRNCALVGEEAVEELDCPKTLIFRDTDLCAVEACTEIAVRGGDDFRQDLRLSCILFRKLGGTLTSLGNSAPQLAKGDPSVAVVRIQENGVEAMIDNRYHVLAGSAEFLRHGGVRVPRESTDVALRRTASVSPMYVAIDGVLKLNYEIQYRTDNAFESLIRDLTETGSAVALYSYDPNLTDTFLQSIREELAEPVRVVKPGRFEGDQAIDLADTGAVTLGKHTDLVYPTHAATAIGTVRRFGFRIQLISTLLGAGIAILLVLLGEQNLLSVLTVAGYHGFWLLVSIIATHSEINKEKLHLE